MQTKAEAPLMEPSSHQDASVELAGVARRYRSRREETVASYFPTAVRAINSTLVDAGWRKDEVDWVIPHNVSVASWEVLMRLAGLTRARLWTDNVARLGHTLAGDNFIDLRDARDAGDVRPGDRALLFSYGYGAHWTGLAVEV